MSPLGLCAVRTTNTTDEACFISMPLLIVHSSCPPARRWPLGLPVDARGPGGAAISEVLQRRVRRVDRRAVPGRSSAARGGTGRSPLPIERCGT